MRMTCGGDMTVGTGASASAMAWRNEHPRSARRSPPAWCFRRLSLVSFWPSSDPADMSISVVLLSSVVCRLEVAQVWSCRDSLKATPRRVSSGPMPNVMTDSNAAALLQCCCIRNRLFSSRGLGRSFDCRDTQQSTFFHHFAVRAYLRLSALSITYEYLFKKLTSYRLEIPILNLTLVLRLRLLVYIYYDPYAGARIFIKVPSAPYEGYYYYIGVVEIPIVTD
ncbi:hypothetical protein QBC39DRAFT_433323 [Podospora conica]|nr:hypothetical protein QBC39DRAFT_433323 [Schizothecium conicum]